MSEERIAALLEVIDDMSRDDLVDLRSQIASLRRQLDSLIVMERILIQRFEANDSANGDNGASDLSEAAKMLVRALVKNGKPMNKYTLADSTGRTPHGVDMIARSKSNSHAFAVRGELIGLVDHDWEAVPPPEPGKVAKPSAPPPKPPATKPLNPRRTMPHARPSDTLSASLDRDALRTRIYDYLSTYGSGRPDADAIASAIGQDLVVTFDLLNNKMFVQTPKGWRNA